MTTTSAQFLYRCTTGLLASDAFGCIVADEMGLGASRRCVLSACPPLALTQPLCPCSPTAGKTLQCISLLHTLLKQSPLPGKPTVEKGIIVCPSTLVKNWANELGPSRAPPAPRARQC